MKLPPTGPSVGRRVNLKWLMTFLEPWHVWCGGKTEGGGNGACIVLLCTKPAFKKNVPNGEVPD